MGIWIYSIVALVGAFWGSFLNVLGYRLIHLESVLGPVRSFCPKCQNTIAWYDLFPVISWIILRGHCRTCGKSISWLYPFIEILTAVVFVLIFMNESVSIVPYRYSYLLFCSLLIVIVRSDIETMLISNFATIYAVPVGWFTAYKNWLPPSLFDSLIGSASGFLLLGAISWGYYRWRGTVGIGGGDVCMCAMLGAFLGTVGWWFALTVGSLVGSLFGMGMMLWGCDIKTVKLPFGVFLALGACVYLFAGTVCLEWMSFF